LLEVANEDLLLLSLCHLAELPQLILLENSERLKVRYPLLSDLFIVNPLVSCDLVSTLRVEVLPPDNVNNKFFILFVSSSLLAPGGLVSCGLEGSFESLQFLLLDTDEL
jgi:hypothetical protein